jgi:5-hydroxyisourate hydrolase
MSTITTHVLDLSRGRPATGINLTLERKGSGEAWTKVGTGKTDGDGRNKELLGGQRLTAGVYRLSFGTGEYYTALGTGTFYPSVTIVFEVKAAGEHHHVPLLVSPYGYSTYRGS